MNNANPTNVLILLSIISIFIIACQQVEKIPTKELKEVIDSDSKFPTTSPASDTNLYDKFSVKIESANCYGMQSKYEGDTYNPYFEILVSGIAFGIEGTEFQLVTNPTAGGLQDTYISCESWKEQPILQHCRRGKGEPETTKWIARFSEILGKPDIGSEYQITARVFGNGDGRGLAADDFTNTICK